jgi:AraC-like DNA-binding protein
MEITFQIQPGRRDLDVLFFWWLTVSADPPVSLTDLYIPELYYDFIYVAAGEIQVFNPARGTSFNLPRQTLKTLHTHPVELTYTLPLQLFGTRLNMSFAETYPGNLHPADSFLKMDWIATNPSNLPAFAASISANLQDCRSPRYPQPLMTPALEETSWLASYSPRHKRRLYRATYGISRKEIMAISNVHSFLEQTCSFEEPAPRIIQHIDHRVFYDQPHLNRAFKQLIGFSPLEYFQASSILQDKLMAASYNTNPA